MREVIAHRPLPAKAMEDDIVTVIAARLPAVAGLFYPGRADELAFEVDKYLSGCAAPTPASTPKALIVPHAGYVYSAPVAAHSYRLLEPAAGRIRRVVMLGPAHRVFVDGLALPEAMRFASPLGEVDLDGAGIDAIIGMAQVTVNDAAHAPEHALEVQLPFLQRVLGSFCLVPLLVGRATPAQVAQVIEMLWGGAETLIVVSSDLSHYLGYEQARRVDAITCRTMLDLDPRLEPMQACGALPINGLLLAARRHGLRAELLDARNSGDTAGDRERVVGYAALAFFDDASAPRERGHEGRSDHG